MPDEPTNMNDEMPTKPQTTDAALVEPSLRLLDAAPVEPSLRLLDEIFDDAADAALDEPGPVDPRATRLAALAQGMADLLGSGVSDGRPIAPTDDPDATDTARIVAMDRGPLTQLVLRLYAIRGESPMPQLDALTEDELRAMVRGLRPPARHV